MSMSESGQTRHIHDLRGMSASPPTPEVSLHCDEPTRRSTSGHPHLQFWLPGNPENRFHPGNWGEFRPLGATAQRRGPSINSLKHLLNFSL
jgi:hypothetical protein